MCLKESILYNEAAQIYCEDSQKIQVTKLIHAAWDFIEF